MPLLEVKNLSYTYDKGTSFSHDAINNISFSVNSGEIIGIIGHTGSGKSTLVSHLNGLIKTEKGRIFVDGDDIWEDPKNIRKFRFSVGLVFQYPEYQLFEDTVYKDIAFGPVNMGLDETEIKKRVLYSAKLVGLTDELLQKSPFDLSGGEKRRAAIAGVMAMQPKVLVLDEPTAGLDPVGRKLILSRIKEYRDQTNSAVIIVSHSMEDMAEYADKILVLKSGEKMMFDKTENVFSNSEMLFDCGLSVPQVTIIAEKLFNKGLIKSKKIFTVSGLRDEILKIKRNVND